MSYLLYETHLDVVKGLSNSENPEFSFSASIRQLV